MKKPKYKHLELHILKIENGFTLLELIITIAIIGILSVIAIPRFFNIGNDAQKASTNAVAAALSSSNSENYAIRIINSNEGYPIKKCTDVANLLQAPLDNRYTIKSANVSVNVTKTCTLSGPLSTTATFSATGIH